MAIQTNRTLQALNSGAKRTSANNRGTSTSASDAYARSLQNNRNTVSQPVTPTTNVPDTTGSSGSSGAGTGTNYYDELYNMFQSENAKARDQMLNAIALQLEATKNAYNKSMQNTGDEYDRLIDQNEVKKARARRLMRENQANLGIGDSGLGRWDKANLDLSYDATSGSLHKAKQQAIDEITNLITQAEAEAENNRANVNNTYTNALLQWKLANL